ncbi:acetyltransferase (GNAT) family protein [Pontibacter mucosus]|uniref:Acetyltransferase (GNAT) family protein n=1 Tax=Pontibacter mucosus TaxID=1649266 RepID=A0A2T5YCZ6_9BACT|nr:GNAT family N-acetyltransferase [Pontibacter mucosus]PTX14389.1 acetyltransferase (GNAT) family protein [Pontibacter mucosus]
MLQIIRTDSNNPDFRLLVSLLDQDLAVRDGAEHAFYAQYNKLVKIQQVVMAYQEGMAVGCGAIKPFETGVAEVKRMYVREELRGQGIARQVMQELERWAAELGYTSCILETGKKQPEAISLYQKCGYTLIPNYGQYKGVENSVCMQKQLVKV